jgi:hypothetical protein
VFQFTLPEAVTVTEDELPGQSEKSAWLICSEGNGCNVTFTVSEDVPHELAVEAMYCPAAVMLMLFPDCPEDQVTGPEATAVSVAVLPAQKEKSDWVI